MARAARRPRHSPSSPHPQDGSITSIFPNDARLRDLTYFSNISVDIDVIEESPVRGSLSFHAPGSTRPSSLHTPCSFLKPRIFQEDPDSDELPQQRVQRKEQVYIGKLPLMLRSTFCALSHTQDYGLTDALECPLDPGGYFIINGSEKVSLGRPEWATGPRWWRHFSPIPLLTSNRSVAP